MKKALAIAVTLATVASAAWYARNRLLQRVITLLPEDDTEQIITSTHRATAPRPPSPLPKADAPPVRQHSLETCFFDDCDDEDCICWYHYEVKGKTRS